ncbi:hypothetical protein QFZ24_009988 [Streptomyces phaeochromogenes]|jgi:hypothetical protein|uniref:hypothetical protein n=1 Tax=Streptomyces phaeochromogenes TaxID=1923 RepID=UPI00279275E5|nr:hypothetical protein [Streptomyces phaeochromogenes]MDQ0955979.1 hypothetical protein [Streptomyces phaeochromogenes]
MPTPAPNTAAVCRASRPAFLRVRFLHDVPVLAAPLSDLLRDGPSAPVWRPVQDPAQQVAWHSWP